MDYDKKSCLIIGAGSVGPAAAHMALRLPQFGEVSLADMSFERAQGAVRRIASMEDLHNERCYPKFLDLDNISPGNLCTVLAMYDVVLSAIPASYSPLLVEACIEVETHFCDLGGDLAVTDQLQKLADRAEKAGIAIVDGAGLMPGLGNMAAQHLMTELGGAEDIVISVCGLPQQPQSPHFYQRTFSIPGLLKILEPTPILRDGELVTVQPYQGMRSMQVEKLRRYAPQFNGNVQSCITAGAGDAAAWFEEHGVQNYWEETPRWSWDALRAFIESFPPDERVAMLEKHLPPTDREHPDLVWMRVSVRGPKGVKQWELLDTYDFTNDLSAMARTTGFTAAAIVLLLAEDKVRPGVWAPEQLGADNIKECFKTLSGSLEL